MRPIIPAQFGAGRGPGGETFLANIFNIFVEFILWEIVFVVGGVPGRRGAFRSGRTDGESDDEKKDKEGARNLQELLFLRNVLRMVGDMVPRCGEEKKFFYIVQICC